MSTKIRVGVGLGPFKAEIEHEIGSKIPQDPLLQSNVGQRVVAVIAEQLGAKKEDMYANTTFIDDLGADTIDTLELVMALEEEFEFEIPYEDAEKITTVGQAIEYINNIY